MDLNKRYIMVVGDIAKGTTNCIDPWYKDTSNKRSELKENLRAYYERMGCTWEEHPYIVRIHKLIHEDNGYVHMSNEYQDCGTTKNFWCK